MTNRSHARLEGLYLLTATLLISHQVDSAYWQEWNLFGMGGGIQLFALLNVPLILAALYGLVQVVREPRVGAQCGVALSVVGMAAFLIHAWFLYRGRPEFRVPASLIVLGCALVTSLGLAWQSTRILRVSAAR